jgi:hypothetical protein
MMKGHTADIGASWFIVLHEGESLVEARHELSRIGDIVVLRSKNWLNWLPRKLRGASAEAWQPCPRPLEVLLGAGYL